MKRRLDESTRAVYEILLERFGEPIDRATATVGISDDRSGKVATRGETQLGDDDLLLDEEDIEEVAPPGMEDTVKKLKGRKDVKNPYALAWHIYRKKNEGLELDESMKLSDYRTWLRRVADAAGKSPRSIDSLEAKRAYFGGEDPEGYAARSVRGKARKRIDFFY